MEQVVVVLSHRRLIRRPLHVYVLLVVVVMVQEPEHWAFLDEQPAKVVMLARTHLLQHRRCRLQPFLADLQRLYGDGVEEWVQSFSLY